MTTQNSKCEGSYTCYNAKEYCDIYIITRKVIMKLKIKFKTYPILHTIEYFLSANLGLIPLYPIQNLPQLYTFASTFIKPPSVYILNFVLLCLF